MKPETQIYFDKYRPYHIISRAVEGRKIFIEEGDIFRFIFQMYVANIGAPAFNLHRQDIKKAALAILNGEELAKKFITDEHEPLVYNLSFVMVVNHHHNILIPNIENGIPKYLQKLHCGFAKYFNLKHNRKANLFERPYKIVPIKTDFQLSAVIRYVNVKNPLDVYQPGWRENGLRSEKEALEFLNKYQFSSFPDLFGKRNSKILASLPRLEKYLGREIRGSQEESIDFVKSYLHEQLAPYYHLFLEE